MFSVPGGCGSCLNAERIDANKSECRAMERSGTKASAYVGIYIWMTAKGRKPMTDPGCPEFKLIQERREPLTDWTGCDV